MVEEQLEEPSSPPATPAAEPAVPETPGAAATPGTAPGPSVPVAPPLPGPPVTSLPEMAGRPWVMSERASDADRDEVVTLLRDHLVAGRLTLDEFSERTGSALGARTKDELGAMLADLPSLSQAPARSTTRRSPRRWIVAVMSESDSKLRWRLGGHTAVVAVMGQCNIDLSNAEIDGPEIVITAVGIMGQIDIVAPEGIDIEVTGLSIMGHRSVATSEVPILRGSPRILVRAFPIMSEVRVMTRSRSLDRPPDSAP
ncbi:MAG: DUF1707 domain-containing protein [Acidimicrobiales bacterium]